MRIETYLEFDNTACYEGSSQQAQGSQRAGDLLPTRSRTGPALMSLKSRIASPWVNPAVSRPFTDTISSPEMLKLKKD